MPLLLIPGCSGGQRQEKQDGGQLQVNCLLLGYDSVITYWGNEKAMLGVVRGNLQDSHFMDSLFAEQRSQKEPMIIKPGGGADLIPNWEYMLAMAEKYGLPRPLIDTIHAAETEVFGEATPEVIKEYLSGKPARLHLPLPCE